MRANLLAVLALGCLVHAVAAQPAPPPPPPLPPPPPSPRPTTTPPAETEDEGLTVRGSSVGYIATAALGDQILFRSDFGYGFAFPNRAEFFYAQGRPGGPGVPLAERKVDFQDLTVYAETKLSTRTSIFLETGARSLNPEVNANSAGWGDSAVGVKRVIYADDGLLTTAQLRAEIPTGDVRSGRSNGHVSLEPALLSFYRLTDRFGIAGELRYWVPVGGTDFAGSVIRYGLGTRYTVWQGERVRVTPTTEVIGWTALGGRQSHLEPNGQVLLQRAAGVTVVNVKIGARIDFGERLGTYAGLGHAITGEKWYRDELRLEIRWLF